MPERLGSDILLVGKWGMFGIQRKEVKDLVASVRSSDRFSREVGQMKQCNYGAWIIEGKWNWTQDGQSMAVQNFDRAQYQGVVFSLLWHGYWVLLSDNPAQTCDIITHLMTWLEKDRHTSLLRRPNPVSEWGTPDSREWAIHMLQSIEGISYELASRIFDHFEGLPLAWTVTKDDFLEIDGIGPGRVNMLWKGIKGAYEDG